MGVSVGVSVRAAALLLFAVYCCCRTQIIPDDLKKQMRMWDSRFRGVDLSTLVPCEFKCPRNSFPEPREGYSAEPKGCKSLGTEVPLDKFHSDYIEVKSCCNDHDICYGTCQSSRTECDTAFHRCMVQSCDRWRYQNDELFETCSTSALILFKTTQIHGCDVYKAFQGKACKCVNQGRLEL